MKYIIKWGIACVLSAFGLCLVPVLFVFIFIPHTIHPTPILAYDLSFVWDRWHRVFFDFDDFPEREEGR